MNGSYEISYEFNVWKYVIAFNMLLISLTAVLWVTLDARIQSLSFFIALFSATLLSSLYFYNDYEREAGIGEKYQFVWMSFITSSTFILLTATAAVLISHKSLTDIFPLMSYELMAGSVLAALAIEYIILHVGFGFVLKKVSEIQAVKLLSKSI